MQESGYRIEVSTEAPDLQPNAWRIYSPTILLKGITEAERASFQNYPEAEHTNVNVRPLSQVSPSCEKEGEEGFLKLTGIRIDIELDFIRNSSSKSLCRRILNENCILSNIVV